MKNEMMIFENSEFGKINVLERDGEPWFVAKEVADILGYSQTNSMNKIIDAEDKHTHTILQNGGNYVNQALINESGLYSAIFGSTLPKAKAFKHWVTSEVLPSIRKTGGYKAESTTSDLDISLSKLPEITASFIAMKALAESMGFDENQRLFSANHAVKRISGVDCMDLIGFKQIEYKPNIQHHTPSVLGDMCGISAIKMNRILQEKELQKETRDYKNRLVWVVTEKGKEFSRMVDTGKLHSDGSPVTQIKWAESVLSL